MCIEINNKLIDSVLTNIEQDIVCVAKYFPTDYRDELKQAIRIKVWKFIIDNTDEFINSELSYIIDTCKIHVYTYAILSSKSILRDKNKYNKRHSNIDNCYLPIYDDHSNVEFSIDKEKYRSILSDREYGILEYLSDIGSNFKNFDSITRQLGYVGKNAAKYNLVNMAKKIMEFNAKNNKY